MFTLKFKTTNAAFNEHEASETGRILKSVSDRIAIDGELEGTIYDRNGNTIGGFKLDNR